jgi:hypothetical protein
LSDCQREKVRPTKRFLGEWWSLLPNAAKSRRANPLDNMRTRLRIRRLIAQMSARAQRSAKMSVRRSASLEAIRHKHAADSRRASSVRTAGQAY